MSSHRIRVAMFIGTRGGASIARAWLARNDVELTLIANAYDDGPGAGMLRHLVPGMPSPTRFRAQLRLLSETSPGVASPLGDWLDNRLPPGAALRELASAVTALEAGAAVSGTGHQAEQAAGGAKPEQFAELARDLRALGAHLHDVTLEESLELEDYALGDLALAGAYLRHDRDFNRTLAVFSKSMGVRGKLFNVNIGDGRFLVALAKDGRIFASSRDMTTVPRDAKLRRLYLLDAPLRADQLVALEQLDDEHRRDVLAVLHADTAISLEATYALRSADIILYGPGTLFTSLLPSYMTHGVRRSIERSKARVRLLLMNLRQSADCPGWRDTEIVDRTLAELGDPRNSRHLITHALSDPYAALRRGGVPHGRLAAHGADRHLVWLTEEVEDPKRPGLHAGRSVVEHALALFRSAEPPSQR